MDDAVLKLLLQHEVRTKTVVKNSVTEAEDGFWRFVFSVGVNSPGQPDARREIGMIAEIVLRLITQAGTQGDVGLNAPVILKKESPIRPSFVGGGLPRRVGVHCIETCAASVLRGGIPSCDGLKSPLISYETGNLQACIGRIGHVTAGHGWINPGAERI